MKTLTLIQENHPGLLAEVTSLLEQHEVLLIDFSGQVFGNTAVMSLTVKPYRQAFRLLSDSGYRVVASDHLLVRLEKHSGALAELSRRLAQANVDVRSMHIVNRDEKAGIVALDTADFEAAQSVLSDILLCQQSVP